MKILWSRLVFSQLSHKNLALVYLQQAIFNSNIAMNSMTIVVPNSNQGKNSIRSKGKCKYR